MNDDVLERILSIIQEDVGVRGLRADAADNLVTSPPPARLLPRRPTWLSGL
jgi:hypothetical protein